MTQQHRGLLPLITLLILFALYGCGTDATTNTGTSVNTPVAVKATVAPTKAPSVFKVGQVVKVGQTWQITVTSAKTSPGGQFDSLKAGNTFLEIEVNLQNISATEQNASSYLFFTLRDPAGQGYNQGYASDAPTAPDGKVAAGSTIKGTLVYEVPASQKTFTFAFSPDFTSQGQTIWTLTV